jgi:hypothetical protein
VGIHCMGHRKACLPRLRHSNLKSVIAHMGTEFVVVLFLVFFFQSTHKSVECIMVRFKDLAENPLNGLGYIVGAVNLCLQFSGRKRS